MEKWLQYFPLEQIHIIDGDSFIVNPATELSSIEKFMGLKPMCTEDKFVLPDEKGFYCIRGCPCMRDEKGHSGNETKVSEKLSRILRDYYAPYVKNLRKIISRTLLWMPKYL